MRFRILLFALSISTVGRPLRAEETETDTQAKIQFEEGVRMYKEGNFDGASIAFSRAYELRPSYKILYNVGLVESELKHYAIASDAYRRYLDQGREEIGAERRAEVEAQLLRLQSLVGSVEIAYSRDGVTVLIDGVRRGTLPLEGPLLVDMGTHELSLRDGVDEIYRESIRVAGGQVLQLNLDSAAEPDAVAAPVDAPPPTSSEESPSPVTEKAVSPPEEVSGPSTPSNGESPEPAEKKGKRKLTWVVLGVAGGAGIAGGVLGGVAMAKESELKKSCNGTVCDPGQASEADTIQAMNIAADVMFGVTAAAAVTAVVLFFVEPRRAERKSAAVNPAIGPSFVGVGGRF